MRRRQFIAGLGSAVAWPLAVRAQQAERVRRIGVLQILAADDPDGMAETAAFLQGLAQLAGPTAATCGSNTAMVWAIPTTFANTWRN
jgi:hypothetical protein